MYHAKVVVAVEIYVVALGALALLGLSVLLGVLEARAQRRAWRALTPRPTTAGQHRVDDRFTRPDRGYAK